MKRFISLFIALTMLLSLAACGTKAEPPKEETSLEQPDTEYSFVVSTDVYEDECTAKDGTVLLRVRYELPHLDIVPDMAGDGVTDAWMLAVQNTFNAEMEQQRSAEIEFFGTQSDAAREDYAYASEYWNAYADEMTMQPPYQTDGGLLSIYESAYIYTGGTHPTNGFFMWNYDLNEGEFLQYSDFTDDEEAFRTVIANEILSQIDEQGFATGLFKGYETSVEELSYADVCFNADGMLVCFPEYILGPHSAGIQSFTIPYHRIAGLLSERGERLLTLSAEGCALSDFAEADELWHYFDMTTMPLDSEDSVEVDGNTYYRVDYRNLKTMDDLRALLLTRFDAGIVDAMLAPFESGAVHYRDIDGVLYGIQCDRGIDISRGDATYAVELTADGSGGRVIATVEEYTEDDPILNEITGRYEYTVGGYATVEFPFVQTEHGAQFTHFESIW